MAKRVLKETVAIGIDPSLTACALVAVHIQAGKVRKIIDSDIFSTDDTLSLPERLETLREFTQNFVTKLRVPRASAMIGAVETPPQGGRMFSSTTVAKCTAACEMGLFPKIIAAGYTAIAVKRYMVPHWYGYSKANWTRAGYTAKFKRSHPSKIAVSSAISQRFNLHIANTDESDAAAIAIYHAIKIGAMKDG